MSGYTEFRNKFYSVCIEIYMIMFLFYIQKCLKFHLVLVPFLYSVSLLKTTERPNEFLLNSGFSVWWWCGKYYQLKLKQKLARSRQQPLLNRLNIFIILDRVKNIMIIISVLALLSRSHFIIIWVSAAAWEEDAGLVSPPAEFIGNPEGSKANTKLVLVSTCLPRFSSVCDPPPLWALSSSVAHLNLGQIMQVVVLWQCCAKCAGP